MKNNRPLLAVMAGLFALVIFQVTALAEPKAYKRSDLFDIANNLAQLDGYYKVVTDPRTGKEEKVAVSYEFAAKVRFNIAKNLVVLKPIVEALGKAREGLVKEVAGEGVTVLKGDTPEYARFDAKWKAIVREEETVDLVRLTESDLNLERNPIPGTVTTALASIIVELAPALAPPATQVAKK